MKYNIAALLLGIFLGCQDPCFDTSCNIDIFQEFYEKDYLVWHERYYPDEAPMFCDEWFYRIDSMYRVYHALDVDVYVDPDQLHDWLFFEWTPHVYQDAFFDYYTSAGKPRCFV